MKLHFLILMVFLAVVAPPALPQQATSPLTKDQVMDLVKFGMGSADLAKKIKEHGIDFEPTDDYLEALRKAGAQEQVIRALREVKPKPLTREQVGELVAGGVASERAATLVEQHGIDFLPDDGYLQTLRLAGADDALIAALREASKAVAGELVVVTSRDAEVFLDGELLGKAGTEGELAVKAKPGAHALKVSLKGKKDFEQSVTLAARQTTKIEARLVDAPGSIRVQTAAGAAILLDGSNRGSADGAGQLVIEGVVSGSHELLISAQGKKEFRQSVAVIPGQQSTVTGTLADLLGSVRVVTSPGAEVYLDGSERGVADRSGQLLVPDVAAGNHILRVSAQGRKEYSRVVDVPAGREATFEAALDELGLAARGDGGGVVFFIFPEMWGKLIGNRLPVKLDGVMLADLRGHTYFAAHVAEGRHKVGTDMYEDQGIEIDVRGSHVYYLVIHSAPSGAGNFFRYELASEDKVHALTPKLTPLQDKYFRDPRAFSPAIP
jgi:hypothetical protein